MCKVKFGLGGNPFNNKKARITGVLARHCHCEMVEGEKRGETKKVIKTNLEFLPEVAAGAPDVEAEEGAEPVVARVFSDAEPGTDTAAWEDAADVF